MFVQCSLLTYLYCSIPKFSTGKSIEPYITSTKKGATVDAKHLVSEEQRKQANGIRIVHDPVEMKKKAAEVWRIPPKASNPSMMKNFTSLSRSWSRLGYHPAPNDFHYIHSYAEKKNTFPIYQESFLNVTNANSTGKESNCRL